MKFTIVIATSQRRTDWLINRSLTSVYRQIGIDKSEWNVFVVDDNENESERDYTYIDDIVNAFISSIEFLKTSDSNVYEIINIGNDNPISLQQLIDLITKTTKRNDIKIVETKFVKGEVTNTHADIDKARRLLNYKPNITIDYGIKQFYEWFEKTA